MGFLIMENQKEIWKDIPGSNGNYQASNLGRIKSFKINPNGYIMSLKNSKGWYLSCILLINNERTTTRIHRAVAKLFVPNPNNKPHVNHKNMNKQDNRAVNLEWTTPKENNDHAIKHKPWKINGMINYNKNIKPNPIIQLDLMGNYIQTFKNGKEAAIETGVCQRNILQVANRTEYKPGLTRKQAGGFIWKFKD